MDVIHFIYLHITSQDIPDSEHVHKIYAEIKKLKPHDPVISMIFKDKTRCQITPRDLKTLAPGTWLNDSVFKFTCIFYSKNFCLKFIFMTDLLNLCLESIFLS